MVKDALRGYVQLANGLSEVTRQRAQQTAKQLLHQTGTENLTTGLTNRVSVLADEIIATSKSNRALLQAIITTRSRARWRGSASCAPRRSRRCAGGWRSSSSRSAPARRPREEGGEEDHRQEDRGEEDHRQEGDC